MFYINLYMCKVKVQKIIDIIITMVTVVKKIQKICHILAEYHEKHPLPLKLSFSFERTDLEFGFYST